MPRMDVKTEMHKCYNLLHLFFKVSVSKFTVTLRECLRFAFRILILSQEIDVTNFLPSLPKKMRFSLRSAYWGKVDEASDCTWNSTNVLNISTVIFSQLNINQKLLSLFKLLNSLG